MRRFILLAVLWACACLLIFAPARWALGFAPAEARAQLVPNSVVGTLWRGQGSAFLPKTSWPVTMSYRVNPLDAMFGRPFAKLVFFGEGLSGAGHVGRHGGKNIKAELELSQLPISDPRISGVAGEVFVTLDELKISPDCKAAAGQVRTNILASNQNRWQGWRGPILSGPISCDGDDVLVALSGADKDIDISANLRLSPEGRYNVDMQLSPKIDLPDELGFVLSAFGFDEQDDGMMQLREQGNIFQGERR